MSFISGLLGGAAKLLTGNPASLVGGLISGGIGLLQKNKANRILDQNPRPQEQMPPEVLANQEAAKQAANEGLPSQQYQNAQKNILRNQVNAVAGAQDRRLGGALIGSIQQHTNDAEGNLDVADAEARRQNQIALQGVNNNVAGWRSKLFDWNQRQKYVEQQNYGMGLLGAGNSNFYSGVDKLAGGLIGNAGNSGSNITSAAYSPVGPGE